MCRPPPTVEYAPEILLLSPPPTKLWLLRARLLPPPHMAARSPVAWLPVPPPTVAPSSAPTAPAILL